MLTARALADIPRRLYSVSTKVSDGLSSLPATAARPLSMAAAGAEPASSAYRPRYIDIGVNLADPIFRGRYHGKQRHPDDLVGVVQRAQDVGCTKLLVTGSSFKSSRDALKLAAQFPNCVYTTAGIHPCSSAVFERKHQRHHEEDEDEDDGAGGEHTFACGPDPSKPNAEDGEVDPAKSTNIIADLRQLIVTATPVGALAAFGEIGLDYDRLHYCSASTQRHAFAAQLALAASLAADPTGPTALPLFLHSRACHADFVRLMQAQFGPRLESLARGGVVHSFTGTAAEAAELMDLGLYLGVNGCSLKTVENCEVVRTIRLDRLMLETDGPWCEVRPSHEGWKYLVRATAADAAAEDAKAKEAQEKADAAGTADTETTDQEAPKETSKAKVPAKGPAKGSKKQQEPAVPARFKTVKKEKWVEGAMVKGRNEPCTIERIATIVAAIKGVPVEEVCEAAWANTVKVFGLET